MSNKELIKKLKEATLSPEEALEIKKFCRKIGVGKSQTVMTLEQMKEKFLKSKEAEKLIKAFPKNKQVAVTAFNVARGVANRPKYADDSELYDDILDIIVDKYL